MEEKNETDSFKNYNKHIRCTIVVIYGDVTAVVTKLNNGAS